MSLMKNKRILLLRFLLVFFPCIEGASRLNEYIRHYEPLTYDPDPVHHSHLRYKRWAVLKEGGDEAEPEVKLSFHSHNRQFKLRLKRDTSAFSQNLEVEGDGGGGTEGVELAHLYAGHVEGVGDSQAFGSLRDGIFDGKIITPEETFYVERAHKYPAVHLRTSTNVTNEVDQDEDTPTPIIIHSVIYSERDVGDPYESRRPKGHAKGCGITDEVMEWMQSIQNSAVDEDEDQSHPKSLKIQDPLKKKEDLSTLFYDDDDHSSIPIYSIYSKEANSWNASNGFLPPRATTRGRGRRAARSNQGSSRTTCTLSIQTDPLLWKHIAEQERTNDENKIREEILSLIAQHVKAVNHIYSNTLFDGKETYKNIRFEVQRIKIDTDKVCRSDYRGSEKNLFCMENIDVSNFLNLHSLSDHEIFCLAYVFTYRDFTGGTLGLAWVASASGASGGVCEKYKTYTETIGGVYQSTKRSLNTGIITFVNYNSRVPPKVSQLTLAHEIGHNFGSPHDFPPTCRPGGPDGNYIMFASATSGDRPNNSKFSECSVRNISSVLDAIIHDAKKHNCFIATNGTFCGNKIVEEGEECDCGFAYEECEEQCCYPRQISEKDRMQNPDAQGCRRKVHSRCSPSEGPCCDQGCRYVPGGPRVLCKQETECSYTSHCNGTSAQCPVPRPRADLTPCNDGTQVCQGGECRGSICLKYGLEECFLSSNDKNVDKRKLCELACQDKNGKCKSTSELGLGGLPGGLSLRPGAPCDNFQGYCDVFLKCRAVDAEGPLARLKNLLFNKQTLLNVAQWVTENWYYVLMMGVAFIIVMGLFIKCCAVHTPSSNPKKAPHIRFTDTLRRPISTLRRHRHGQYRAANAISSSSTSNGNGPLQPLPPPPSSSNNSSHPSSHHSHPHSSSHSSTPSGAPPPYSAIAGGSSGGVVVPPVRGGPPHGFGEGRGPNRNKERGKHQGPVGPGGVSGGGRSSYGGGGGAYKDSGRHQQHRV